MQKQSLFPVAVNSSDLATPATSARGSSAPDRLEETLDLLRLAQEVSLAASIAISTEMVLDGVLERICHYTGCQIGHVWQQSAAGTLEPSNLWRLSDAERMQPFCEATRHMSLNAGDGLVGSAAQGRRAVWWSDLQTSTDFPRRHAASVVGVRSGFAFPSFYADRVVAVFEFFTSEDAAPSEPFLEVMTQIGTLIGNVFERRRTEARLSWSDTLLRRMTNATQLGFYVVDERDGLVLYSNKRFHEIWMLPSPDGAGTLSSQDVFVRCRSCVAHFEGAELFGALDPQSDSEGEVTLSDGRTIRHVSTVIGGDRTSPLGRMHVHEDVTQRKRAEKKFRDLLEAAPDGMVIVGQGGRIALVNVEAERMFGYKRDDLLGRPVETLVPLEKQHIHTDHRARFLGDPHTRPMGAGLNLYARRRDGTEFPAEISLSPLTTEDGLMVIAAVRDVTPRKQLERQLSEAAWREQQVLGQELHDGLGGALTGLCMMTASLRDKLTAIDSGLAAKAQEIAGCAQGILNTTKDLAHGLVPVQIEANGFAAALEELARDFAARFEITCTFESSAAWPVHDRVLATHLFRIAQEALTNAVRHSRAHSVRIKLDTGSDQLALAIEDDGCGFSRPEPGKGLGLHGMQHRAGLIGGTLQIRSRVGGGTTVTCVVKGWMQHVDIE